MRTRRRKNEQNKIEELITQMTSQHIKEIVFDSEIDSWNIKESIFVDKIQGKKGIIVLVEDERNNLFGGYIGNKICL